MENLNVESRLQRETLNIEHRMWCAFGVSFYKKDWIETTSLFDVQSWAFDVRRSSF